MEDNSEGEEIPKGGNLPKLGMKDIPFTKLFNNNIFVVKTVGDSLDLPNVSRMNQEYFNSHVLPLSTNFTPAVFPDVYQTPPKYDAHASNEKSIKLCLLRRNFWKNRSKFWEEEQTQPEYLQELLQSLLKDLQILNEIQPLKQETPNQIQKDQEEKSIAELLAEERLQKANQALNESQSPQEIRIQDLEIQKQQCLEEMKEWMNDLGIREYQKEEIRYGYRGNTCSSCSNLPEIVEACVDDDDTDDDDDYDDDVYVDDCVEEDEERLISTFLLMTHGPRGEDTTSIDALPLDDSMILPEYESFTFDDEPVMAEVNVFDEINTSELSLTVLYLENVF
ncbi:hypothetical protein Tco_0684299 [Tanacetum coccineum]